VTVLLTLSVTLDRQQLLPTSCINWQMVVASLQSLTASTDTCKPIIISVEDLEMIVRSQQDAWSILATQTVVMLSLSSTLPLSKEKPNVNV
jgi:hypothetical protein